MNITKNICIVCHIPFDDSIHLPRSLPNCTHTICSLCLSKNLLTKRNTFMCPKDNIIYSNVDNIDYFKVNKNILEKIKQSQSQNIQTQNDSTKIEIISLDKEKTKSSKTKIDTITVNDSTLNNNTNTLTTLNNQNTQQCYIKKTIKFNKKLQFTNNSLICSIHSLPLNVICVNDRQKICSQCALNNLHLEHQIITETKFMDYVNELFKILQEIEINKNSYAEMSDINTSFILEEIENKIDFYKNDIKKICKEIIENINLQCKQIEKFLNLRKKEIFTKFQFTNYNIDNLRESTNHWLDLVNNKLSEANSGNNNDDINIESLKLLDVDKNKNIFNLLDIGRQLNERYNFVKETKDIVDKLNEFNIKGINVEKNSEIIDLIMMSPISIEKGIKGRNVNNNFINKYNYNESIITSSKSIAINADNEKADTNKTKNDEHKLETSLFKIEEDKSLIESLHLTPISYLYRQTKNIFITYENDNELEDNEVCNSISNIYNLCPTHNNKDNNNNIYLKKKLNVNKMSKTQNNFFKNNNDKITINKKIIIMNDNKEKEKQKRLALSGGNTRYNTNFYKNNDDNFDKNSEEKDINMQLSPMYRKVLFPKLLKVKTCDVFLIGNEKMRKSMSMDDDEMKKKINKLEYNHGNTLHKLTMSPQIKSKYNLNSNKNMTGSKKDKEKENHKSKSKKDLKKKAKTNNESKNSKNEIKPRKKYIRCVSCSGLNKNDIKDTPIIFNLNVNNENNFNSSKNNNNNKSTVSDFLTNNDTMLKHKKKSKNKTKKINSRHLNKSCVCKQENKTNYNIANFNNNYSTNFSTNVSINNINKNNNLTFINKDMNDLQKCINTQMKKSNPSFNRINMNGIGMKLLCNYLQKNQKKKYKELKLPGCNLDDGDFSLLIKNIIDNEIEISTLNVSYNNLSDNSSRYIFEMIIKNKNSLKSIFMYNNMFSKGFKNKIKNYDKDNNLDSIKLYI